MQFVQLPIPLVSYPFLAAICHVYIKMSWRYKIGFSNPNLSKEEKEREN